MTVLVQNSKSLIIFLCVEKGDWHCRISEGLSVGGEAVTAETGWRGGAIPKGHGDTDDNRGCSQLSWLSETSSLIHTFLLS